MIIDAAVPHEPYISTKRLDLQHFYYVSTISDENIPDNTVNRIVISLSYLLCCIFRQLCYHLI